MWTPLRDFESKGLRVSVFNDEGDELFRYTHDTLFFSGVGGALETLLRVPGNNQRG